MRKIELYTDGACSGNPGPGGWACILIYNNSEKELSGYEPETTNNRMELMAVIKGFEALREPCQVTVYSDSSYIVNAFNQGWIENWIANHWKRGPRKEPVLNKDLWKKLLSLIKKHQVSWIKVKGHSGHKLNDRADQLAVKMIRDNQPGGKK